MNGELDALRATHAHMLARVRETRVRTRDARARARHTRAIARSLRSRSHTLVRARGIIVRRHRPTAIAGGSDVAGETAKVILLVDDHVDTRDMYAEFLKAMGFMTRQAATCEEALATCRAGGVDALVLDRRLPDGDGDDVCRALKADLRTRALPIVMLSGRRQDGATAADVYLLKPVVPDDLVRHLTELLALGDGGTP